MTQRCTCDILSRESPKCDLCKSLSPIFDPIGSQRNLKREERYIQKMILVDLSSSRRDNSIPEIQDNLQIGQEK